MQHKSVTQSPTLAFRIKLMKWNHETSINALNYKDWNHIHSLEWLFFKATRPSYFVGVPSYFEAFWYPHLYFDRKSNI